MSDEERFHVHLDSKLKRLIDADSRTNKEVAHAALWKEFGGQKKETLEHRIELKKRRLENLRSEKRQIHKKIQKEMLEFYAMREDVEYESLDNLEKRIEEIEMMHQKLKILKLIFYVIRAEENMWDDGAPFHIVINELIDMGMNLYEVERGVKVLRFHGDIYEPVKDHLKTVVNHLNTEEYEGIPL